MVWDIIITLALVAAMLYFVMPRVGRGASASGSGGGGCCGGHARRDRGKSTPTSSNRQKNPTVE
jgi:hypothetical protein